MLQTDGLSDDIEGEITFSSRRCQRNTRPKFVCHDRYGPHVYLIVFIIVVRPIDPHCYRFPPPSPLPPKDAGIKLPAVLTRFRSAQELPCIHPGVLMVMEKYGRCI